MMEISMQIYIKILYTDDNDGDDKEDVSYTLKEELQFA